MKVFNIYSNEEIEIHHGSPKFAVQWCAAISQDRSLEFAAMSETERDQEFPVTEGTLSISCGDYCTQIEGWRYAKKQWESLKKATFQAKKAYEAALIAEISRKYPSAELIRDYDVYENRDYSSIRYENEEFSLWEMTESEEQELENSYPEFYAWLKFRQA